MNPSRKRSSNEAELDAEEDLVDTAQSPLKPADQTVDVASDDPSKARRQLDMEEVPDGNSEKDGSVLASMPSGKGSVNVVATKGEKGVPPPPPGYVQPRERKLRKTGDKNMVTGTLAASSSGEDRQTQ